MVQNLVPEAAIVVGGDPLATEGVAAERSKATRTNSKSQN